MKILEPKQVSQGKALELTRDSAKLTTVREALKSEQSRLDDVEARFDIALSNQRVRWANEEKEATERISALLDHIRDLEQQRNRLLVPIDIERQRAHTLLKDAETALLDANKAKDENECAAETLQKRLDDVSERELLSKDREQRLDTREMLVKSKEERASSMWAEIASEQTKFINSAESRDYKISQKERELELRELSIKAREDDIDGKAAAVVARERLVNDKYATLQRTIKRTNKDVHEQTTARNPILTDSD